jgi:hypothetical protein
MLISAVKLHSLTVPTRHHAATVPLLVPHTDPFRPEHLLGMVVSWLSVWPDP